jgi:hypothetical protein
VLDWVNRHRCLGVYCSLVKELKIEDAQHFCTVKCKYNENRAGDEIIFVIMKFRYIETR